MDQQDKPTVVALVGPTASGKTALSLKLAQSLNAEIVACDSRTVYKEFDIGTAKPNQGERQEIPHHLIDICEPEDHYTVAQYVTDATKAIFDIGSRGKIPLITGGTGFYAKALLQGLSMPAVSPQEELRARYQQLADEKGNAALFQLLKDVDPDTAARLNVNDRFRVIRALEVYEVTGKPFSQAAERCDPPFRTIWIGLTANDRSFLHRNIHQRLEIQVREGLIEEVESLYKRFGPRQNIMRTVNYKEFVQLFEGVVDKQQAMLIAEQHNVQLARRQLIWFRANQEIAWFEIDRVAFPELKQAVESHIRGIL